MSASCIFSQRGWVWGDRTGALLELFISLPLTSANRPFFFFDVFVFVVDVFVFVVDVFAFVVDVFVFVSKAEGQESYGLGAWDTSQNHRPRFQNFLQNWVK